MKRPYQRVFRYTYADLARAFEKTEGAVRQQAWKAREEGKRLPFSQLLEVLQFWLDDQLLKRFRSARTRSDLGLRAFEKLSVDERFFELAKVLMKGRNT